MKIEEEIFLKTQVDPKKLEAFGFKKEKNTYLYKKEFMNHFQANITIEENGRVVGKIIDLHTHDEYTGFRNENNVGEFAGRIRESYETILKEIKSGCFVEKQFLSNQANRIASLIKEKYNVSPEFLWDDENGVFRSTKTGKWFGIMMDIPKSKLEKEAEGKVEIINLKTEEKDELIKQKGIYEAYHMNKKSWISIVLDDTLTDSEIMNLIAASYHLVSAPNHWIIPANPKVYDIQNHFKKQDTIEWHTNFQVDKGDIVFIYMTSPYSCILYKCEIISVSFPKADREEKQKKGTMLLKLIKNYKEGQITIEHLNVLGIKSIRCQRKIPTKICEYLEKSGEANA